MTFDLSQPIDLPEYLESGTLSVQNIATLAQGVKFIKSNQDKILKHEIHRLNLSFINRFQQILSIPQPIKLNCRNIILQNRFSI